MVLGVSFLESSIGDIIRFMLFISASFQNVSSKSTSCHPDNSLFAFTSSLRFNNGGPSRRSHFEDETSAVS